MAHAKDFFTALVKASDSLQQGLEKSAGFFKNAGG